MNNSFGFEFATQAAQLPMGEWEEIEAGRRLRQPKSSERGLVQPTGQSAAALFSRPVPPEVKHALSQRKETLAIQLAARSGLRDATELAYLVFHARHPKRQGRWLKRREPGFQQLTREWADIRKRLVQPVLAQQSVRYATPARELVSPYKAELPTEMEWEEEGPVPALALGFDILKSSIGVMTQGDLNYTGPLSQIGVTWPNKPALNYNTTSANRLIINFEENNPITGIEQVNVKLRCYVDFNGPEVTATFLFDADGKRSRLLRDTSIVINNPLSIETRPTSAEWQRLGIGWYPVVKIPIEFRVDRPWPLDNYNLTFLLVLSGMYGFGATSGGAWITDKQEAWN